MNESDVAVVIPCHSYPQFLSDALESVECQSIEPWKTFCVLDHPGLTELIEYQDYELDWIYPEGMGVSAARNAGFQAAINAGYDWVIPLDEDDILHPDYVKEMLRSVVACPDRLVHYPDWNEFGSVAAHHRVDEYSWDRLAAAPYIISTAMIHTSVWEAVKEKNGTGYDKELSRRGLRWEDYLFYLEAGALGYTMARVGKGLVRVRRHGPSGTDIANETIPEWREYAKAKLNDLYGVAVPW